jgi:multiple sugar transport system ATP-binding protein
VIVGIRPEHFEDAALARDRPEGHTVKTTIDVLESVGSEFYAHFTVASEPAFSTELRELAHHNGTGGTRIVARLEGASRIRQGQVAELWFDTTKLHLFDDRSGRNLLANDASDSDRTAA